MTTKLKEVTIDQLAKLNKDDLKQLCKDEGLEADGTKKELFKRLFVQKTGRSDTFSPANTKCRICSEPVKVKSTRRQGLSDGRTLIIRQVQCTGKHRHTYPLKEIITPEPSTSDASAGTANEDADSAS